MQPDFLTRCAYVEQAITHARYDYVYLSPHLNDVPANLWRLLAQPTYIHLYCLVACQVVLQRLAQDSGHIILGLQIPGWINQAAVFFQLEVAGSDAILARRIEGLIVDEQVATGDPRAA